MTNKELKILFIIPTLNPGGIETYLLRFLKFVEKDQLIKPHVLVRNFNKGPLFEQYEALGITIYSQPLGYFNLKNVQRYFKLLINNQFDAVCDFNGNFAGVPMWLAKKAKIKNRIAFYRQGKDHFKKSLFKSLYNLFVKHLVKANCTQILSNSESALNYFHPSWKSDNRYKVIYNGLDLDNFLVSENKLEIRKSLGISLNKFVITHVGRLDPMKNHGNILKVANELKLKGKEVLFILCGLGVEDLKIEIEALNLGDSIILLGFRKDVNRILKASDAFYFPSFSEGQPNSLIEAMLIGLPFVASDINSIREMVPQHMMQFLVNPNEVSKSVQLLQQMMSAENSEMVLENQNWAIEKFSSTDRFKEFYQCLVK